MKNGTSIGRRAAWTTRALLVCLWLAACDGRPAAPSDVVPGETSVETVSLQLDADAIARVGVEVAPAESSEIAAEMLAYGRVLDPAPVSEAIANLAAARAAADASARELRRVDALAQGRENASAREVEAARASAARAQADLELAGYRVAALLGSAPEATRDLPTLARRLGRREVALVRVDVPGAETRPLPERGAELTVYPDPGQALTAGYLGPAPDADPLRPGWGFLFLVTEAPPPVGSPVRARLALPGEALAGARVPGSALLRSEGQLAVFVAGEEGRFERRPIQARLLPDGAALVTAGLVAGELVVTAGAQQLLSVQRFGAGGEAPED